MLENKEASGAENSRRRVIENAKCSIAFVSMASASSGAILVQLKTHPGGKWSTHGAGYKQYRLLVPQQLPRSLLFVGLATIPRLSVILSAGEVKAKAGFQAMSCCCRSHPWR